MYWGDELIQHPTDCRKTRICIKQSAGFRYVYKIYNVYVVDLFAVFS